MAGFQALCSLPLGEAHLLAGRLEEAHASPSGPWHSPARQEAGNQAMRAAAPGEIAARGDPPEVAWP